ncbi:MAG: ribosome assembly RNA-binding protein YhbY [Clostridia bacterium]|nr:ribosome assembly RNA-binding protein YhbY [Clostridia bacterium]
MITTKQRAYLRGLANKEDAIIQIGKNGIGDNLLKTVSDALEARELVKLTIMETVEESPKELMTLLTEALGCEAVQVIGRKLVLYRESKENKKIVLPR